MSNFTLRTRTVGEWKKEGFQFEPAADCIDCTRISAAFPFSYARSRFYASATELYEAFLENPEAICLAENDGLILAGKYLLDTVELPLYLLAQPVRAKLLRAREEHQEALRGIAQAQGLALKTLEQYA